MEFKTIIKKLRRDRDMTQEALAETLADMESAVFDFLREDREFCEIAEKLKPHAGKWAVS